MYCNPRWCGIRVVNPQLSRCPSSRCELLALLLFAGFTVGMMGGCQPATESPSSVAATDATASDEPDHETVEGAPAEDHDAHDSLEEIVPLLKAHRDTVRDAFAAGKPHDADDAIHEAAHLCKHLVAAGKAAQLAGPQMVELSLAADQMFGALHAIHEGFHSDAEGKSYDDVASDMDKSIEKLEELATTAKGA